MADRMTPEQVATLERAIGTWLTFSPLREWAILMLQGNDVPTVEQWEAAARLAALTRNDAHPDSIVAKLANLISPPEPPLPEIAECPYCGASCDLVGGAVQCRARCNYVGPARDNARDSIQAHNEVAAKLRPAKEPRACGGCKHFDPDPGLLCRTAHYTGGQALVLNRHAVPTRDASECERWEAKP